MPDRTPNHDLPLPDPGSYQGSWGTDILNDDLTQKLEERVPIRDDEANLDTYTPHVGARFEALDTETVYVGDGTSWVLWTSTGQNPSFESADVGTLTSGVVEFDPVFRDTGRFEMVHLNTFNVGGDAKQAEVNLTIADYTDKDINKILLFCEHLSVYTSSGGAQTFAVQINGQSGAGAYENMRVDGSTTSNDHAIIAKAAANTEPMMGHVWFHADQDFMVYPEGSPRGAGIDGTIHRAAVDNAQSSTPWTIDSLRFYTPDGDEIRMRRATVLGFSEGAN